MNVKKISKAIADSVVSKKHYSKSLGIFWEGFGLYKDDILIGVCCFGQPSASIQKHSFQDRDFRLYELTRLVVDAGHQNAASFLISQSIKMLKEKPRCCGLTSRIVSTSFNEMLQPIRMCTIRHCAEANKCHIQ